MAVRESDLWHALFLANILGRGAVRARVTLAETRLVAHSLGSLLAILLVPLLAVDHESSLNLLLV